MVKIEVVFYDRKSNVTYLDSEEVLIEDLTEEEMQEVIREGETFEFLNFDIYVNNHHFDSYCNKSIHHIDVQEVLQRTLDILGHDSVVEPYLFLTEEKAKERLGESNMKILKL